MSTQMLKESESKCELNKNVTIHRQVLRQLQEHRLTYVLDLENVREIGESCGEGGRKMFELLDPQIYTTINLPNEQEGKGKNFLDCHWLSSSMRRSSFDFAFVFVMKNFVVP